MRGKWWDLIPLWWRKWDGGRQGGENQTGGGDLTPLLLSRGLENETGQRASDKLKKKWRRWVNKQNWFEYTLSFSYNVTRTRIKIIIYKIHNQHKKVNNQTRVGIERDSCRATICDERQRWKIMQINSCSHPLLHALDDEAQVFTHLLFAQVLLFTALQEGQVLRFRMTTGSNMTL